MQPSSCKKRDEVFRKNVLKRLYGTKDTTEPLQEQNVEHTEVKTVEADIDRTSKSSEKKVYTVALPPEGYNPDTKVVQHPDPSDDSSSPDSSDDETVKSSSKPKRRRKRGKSKAVEKEFNESNSREESGKELNLKAALTLTKNQKRKLKKKRQKERQKKSMNTPFVYSNPDQLEEAKLNEITRQKQAAELLKEKTSLLEFVDGAWDVMLAEGRSRGNSMEREEGLKQALDSYIMAENSGCQESITHMSGIKQAAMLKDGSLVQEKIREMKTKLENVSSAVNFFCDIVSYWLEEVVKI